MSRGRNLALAGCAALLIGLTGLGLYLQQRDELDRFVAVAAAQGVVYLAAVWTVWRDGASRRTLVPILVVAAVLRLPVLLAPPYLSSDLYRYVWDGRVAAAGINPYRYIPADPRLAPLRDGVIFPHINRAAYAPTIYPPMAEAIFFAVARVSASPRAVKAAMVGFEAVTVAVLLRLLAETGLPSARILVYAWHPVPLWEFAGSGHIDAALIAFVVLALWARRQERGGFAGLALASATLTKFLPAVLLPALLRRREWRLPAAFAVAILSGYLPFLGAGWGVLGYLPGYIKEEGFSGGGYGFVLLQLIRWVPGLAGLPTLVYIAAAAVVMACLAAAIIAWRDPGDGDVGAAALLAGIFMMSLSPHYPWYFAWLIIFACLDLYRSLLWLTNAVMLLYLVQFGSPLAAAGYRGVVDAAIYGPFVALALIDIGRRQRRARRS